MADLIDRQAAIDAMGSINDSICEQQAIDALYALPSADAVKVVRCADCKYAKMGECEHKLGLIVANDENYCSYGERKDGKDKSGRV